MKFNISFFQGYLGEVRQGKNKQLHVDLVQIVLRNMEIRNFAA